MNRRFFELEENIRQNRLETRKRAIANGWNTKIDENGRLMPDDEVTVSEDITKSASDEAQQEDASHTQEMRKS